MKLANEFLNYQFKNLRIAESSFLINRMYAARSDSNYLKSIGIASNSLGISEKSLETIQRNFQTENKAIIFLHQIKIDTLAANRINQIKIRLQNFGKSPTILASVYRNILFDTIPVLSEVRLHSKGGIVDFINMFMSVNGTFDFNVPMIPLTQNQINLIATKKLYAFIYGEAVYYDIVRKQNSVYEFCFKVHHDGTFEATPNHNMVIEVRDK